MVDAAESADRRKFDWSPAGEQLLALRREHGPSVLIGDQQLAAIAASC